MCVCCRFVFSVLKSFHLCSQLHAGMLTLTTTNPIWVVKTRLCLTNTSTVPSYMRYSGLRDGLIKLYSFEGIKGLYRGFVPGLFGTSHGAIQFMLYEEMKKMYSDYKSISINTKLVRLLHACLLKRNKTHHSMSGTLLVHIYGCFE